jgi:hypothetical protein
MLCSLLAGQAFAQTRPYNPYAASQDEFIPVAKDGKLNWPAYFKSKQLEDRFQSYFAMGSCCGTNQAINNMLRDNKVDVNQLPESSVLGAAALSDPGTVTLGDRSAGRTVVVAHPAGVTKINVFGEMPVSELKPDMVVRFLGRVDHRGTGTDLIEAIEVITPGPMFNWRPVEANREQTITGKVVRIQGPRLQVRVDAGKMHRLTFQVSDKTRVKVDGNSLGLISAGDQVSAAGHIFGGPSTGGSQIVFASEITVIKAISAAKGVTLAKSDETAKAEDAEGAVKSN